MSWLNMAVRSAGMLLLLPAVLATSTPAEVVVWMLLANTSFYVLLADFGFLPTFTRELAQASPSAAPVAASHGQRLAAPPRNPQTVVATMRLVYRALAAATFVVLLGIGAMALANPIGDVREPALAWTAAAAALVGSTVAVLGNQHLAFLTGRDRIAESQRLLASTGAAGFLCAFGLLLLGRSAFTAIIAQQVWVVIGVLGSARLARRVNAGHAPGAYASPDRAVMASIWSSAWRSGLATLLTVGSLQAANLLVAQSADRLASGSYLLSLRILQAVSQFSQVPFYSHIPALNRLHAEGKLDSKVGVAVRMMRRSYWLYVAGFMIVGLSGDIVLRTLGSEIVFSNRLTWALLGLALLGERFGAMHIQLYSTTNRIVWHIAALRYSCAFAAMALILFPLIDLGAAPIALAVACWGAYAPYCARLSYSVIGTSAWEFERYVLLPPLLAMLVFISVSLILSPT